MKFRSSQNVRNSIWSLANIAFYPAAFLASTPFFIDRLGEETFGVWMLVNSYVFITVHIVSFGLSNAITAHVAEALGNQDHRKLLSYLGISSLGLWLLAGLFAIGGAMLLLLYHLELFAFVSWESTTVLASIIATFFIGVKFPELLFQSIYKGYEAYHKASIFNMINRFGALAAQVFLVLQGFSLVEIFISNLTINAAVVLVQWLDLKRKIRGYRLYRTLRTPEGRDIFKFGFWTWLQTITGILAYQIDRFVVAYFLGTAVVAYYTIAATIANHLHLVCESLVSWLFPKIARIKEESGETKPYYFTIRAFLMLMSLAGLTILYLLREPIFNIWLGPEKAEKVLGFMVLFIIYESVYVLSITPKIYLNAIKRLKLITGIEFAYKLGSIAGMFVLFYWFRTAESLILGQIIALCIGMPIVYWIVNKKVLHENTLVEVFGMVSPSILLACSMYFNSPGFKLVGLLATGASVWFFYFRNRFQKSLLLE